MQVAKFHTNVMLCSQNKLRHLKAELCVYVRMYISSFAYMLTKSEMGGCADVLSHPKDVITQLCGICVSARQ